MIICSFSGGRSSAMMLNEMRTWEDVKVIFCNTGMESDATLDFVRDCEEQWGIPIVWLEYSGKKAYKVVNYESASRNGEPFDQLTTDRSYLPNMIARFCTVELKVLTIDRYLADEGIAGYEMAVGILGDEPRRLARMRADPLKENYLYPIAWASEQDVHTFWQGQEFDLKLPDAAVNLESNCTLCFLKGGKIKQSLIKKDPSLADWWIGQEEKIGGRFRTDQPSYAEMKIIARDQPDMFGSDDSFSCFCGD
jgi:3'-phosphoadenosine 5'-phosphosulfate sulfotransferase (PAPS reductase)/FAD synthetase